MSFPRPTGTGIIGQTSGKPGETVHSTFNDEVAQPRSMSRPLRPEPLKPIEYTKGGWPEGGGGPSWVPWLMTTMILAILSAVIGFIYGRYF